MKPIKMKHKSGEPVEVHPAQVKTYEARGYSCVKVKSKKKEVKQNVTS